MIKEIHIVLDNSIIETLLYTTFDETDTAIRKAMKSTDEEIIYTTQIHFLSFFYLPARLFVHYNNEIHEIQLYDTDGTNRYIKEEHNLEKLLISGEFDWYCN